MRGKKEMQRSLGRALTQCLKTSEFKELGPARKTAVVQDIACFPSCLWGILSSISL